MEAKPTLIKRLITTNRHYMLILTKLLLKNFSGIQSEQLKVHIEAASPRKKSTKKNVSQNNVFSKHKKNNLVNFGTMIIKLKLSLTYMT